MNICEDLERKRWPHGDFREGGCGESLSLMIFYVVETINGQM